MRILTNHSKFSSQTPTATKHILAKRLFLSLIGARLQSFIYDPRFSYPQSCRYHYVLAVQEDLGLTLDDGLDQVSD
ncbi:hypothetical protein AVO44_06105 [Ruegeria profundi]|uniref:Uncharacterized protein n=1 Tax=Ruegeria profundi TaxID=1685378 RepID=A0A0X3U2C9_9RHOB|nr:hypothetical protein AVO44_06105 [Ruegeria profundi]